MTAAIRMSATAGSEKTIELVPIAAATAIPASFDEETVKGRLSPSGAAASSTGLNASVAGRRMPGGLAFVRSNTLEAVTDQYAFLPEMSANGVAAMM
jgi:hypothetical protein